MSPQTPAQLANLRRGNADGGGFQSGNTASLTHGLRARSPLRHLDNEMVDELRAAILDAIPTRDVQGRVAAGDELQAEVLAVMGYQVLQAAGYFAKHPDEALPALETWSRMAERYSRGLERLGIGASARARLGLDMVRGQSLAEQMAALPDEGEDTTAPADDVVDEREGAGDA